MKRFFSIQFFIFTLALTCGQNRSTEQTVHGPQAPVEIVASFDGLGYGFEGPQGKAEFRIE